MRAQREFFIFRKQRESNAFNHFFPVDSGGVSRWGRWSLLGLNSIKSNSEIALNPLGLPRQVHLDNFGNAWEKGEFNRTFKNSVILVIGTVAAELVLGGLAAYSLARKNPPGANFVMIYLLVASTVPDLALSWCRSSSLWRQLGLLNTYHGLILIYTALNAPFSIFLLRSYSDRIACGAGGCGAGRRSERAAGIAPYHRAAGLARLLDGGPGRWVWASGANSRWR